jgi:hypothetical protein
MRTHKTYKFKEKVMTLHKAPAHKAPAKVAHKIAKKAHKSCDKKR